MSNEGFRRRGRRIQVDPRRRPGRARPLLGNLQALESRVLLSATGADDTYGQLPLTFEPNVGQVASDVQFLTRGEGYLLALGSGDAQLQLQKPADTSTGAAPSPDVVQMQLIGADAQAAVAGFDPLPGKVNYLVGTDPSQWRTDIPTYGGVSYGDVYPGVDLIYYGNQRQLEYDFVVKPGADPGQIHVGYDGASSMSLDAAGNLVLGTSGGQIVVHAPVLYQQINGQRHDVAGSFSLTGDEVGFSVGSYDHSQPLVIDPILIYSTYFGGAGDDQALAVTVDGQGAAYFTGSTLSTDLATTAGAVAPSSFIADLFKSGDKGVTWQGAGNGLPDADFSSVVVDPRNPNTIYAATFNDRQTAQGLFKSIDGGKELDRDRHGPDAA